MHMAVIIGLYAIPSSSSIQQVSSLNGCGKVQFSNSSFLNYSSLIWAFTSWGFFIKITLFSIAQNALLQRFLFFTVTFNPRNCKKVFSSSVSILFDILKFILNQKKIFPKYFPFLFVYSLTLYRMI